MRDVTHGSIEDGGPTLKGTVGEDADADGKLVEAGVDVAGIAGVCSRRTVKARPDMRPRLLLRARQTALAAWALPVGATARDAL